MRYEQDVLRIIIKVFIDIELKIIKILFKEILYRTFFDYKISNVKCVYNVDDNAHIFERFKLKRFIIINLFNLIIKLFANDSKIFNYVYLIIFV